MSGTHASLDGYRVLVSPASRSCAAAKDRSREGQTSRFQRAPRGHTELSQGSVGGCRTSWWQVGDSHASIFLRAAAPNIVLLARCCAAESDTGRPSSNGVVCECNGGSLLAMLARWFARSLCSVGWLLSRARMGWDGMEWQPSFEDGLMWT